MGHMKAVCCVQPKQKSLLRVVVVSLCGLSQLAESINLSTADILTGVFLFGFRKSNLGSANVEPHVLTC